MTGDGLLPPSPAGLRRSCRGHPSRRGLSAAPQDEVLICGTKSNPHGEEALRAVSNHEANMLTCADNATGRFVTGSAAITQPSPHTAFALFSAPDSSHIP